VGYSHFFFKKILKIQNSIDMIPYYKSIHYDNFHKINIQEIYNLLFFDLGDRDRDSNKLVHKLKWSLTFDEESDTPGKAGGLMSVTAPRAGVLTVGFSLNL